MYKVIIADDESIMRKALLKLIDWEALDCKVILAAEDGQAVIDYFETEKPDIIISDIRMPRVDGLKLAEYLSQNEPQIKLILLTAYADFAYAQQAIRCHVSEYVVKQGASDQIVAAVKRCKKQLAAERMYSGRSAENSQHMYRMAVEGGNPVSGEGVAAALPDAPRYLLVQCLSDNSQPEEGAGTDWLNRAAGFLSDTLGDSVLAQFSEDGLYQYFLLREVPVQMLEKQCRKAMDSFRCVTGADFLVGISSLCMTTAGLAAASQQAREALDYGFYDSGRTIHHYLPDHPFGTDCAAFYSTYNARFASALQLGAVASTGEILKTICEFERDNEISPELVRREAEQLAELCRSSIRSAGAYWSDAVPDGDQLLVQRVKSCVSFEVCCRILQELVEKSCLLISRALQQHSDIVLLAKSYIHTNFQRDLSLNEIAAAVNVNPSYLSRTFKARTGASIVDTITECRISKAKTLLTEGHLRIQDIAVEVGIENTTYFSQVFKKHTGMSPKDYQKFASRKIGPKSPV